MRAIRCPSLPQHSDPCLTLDFSYAGLLFATQRPMPLLLAPARVVIAQARELEAENKQLRRTISSLAKATAAERDTYLALQSDLESYQDIVTSIAQEYDLNRSPVCVCGRGCMLACTDSQSLLSSRPEQREVAPATRGEAVKNPPLISAANKFGRRRNRCRRASRHAAEGWGYGGRRGGGSRGRAGREQEGEPCGAGPASTIVIGCPDQLCCVNVLLKGMWLKIKGALERASGWRSKRRAAQSRARV